MNEALAQIVALATKPVSDSSPTGESVRYEPEFETLKAEIDKISRVSGGEVDWSQVRKLSSEILEKKSKDLLVASYLCLGLFQIEGYPGLGEGLQAVRQLMTTFWENLYPEKKRMKARVSALEWLAERLEAALEKKEATLADQEALKKCRDCVGEIDEFLGEALGSDSPSLGSLTRALEAQEREEEPAPAPAAAPPAAAPRPVATAAAPAPAREMDLSTPQGVQRALKQTLSDLARLARHLREQNPANPLSYRLSRLDCWSGVENLPPNENGKTMIPPPEDFAQALQGFGTMQNAANWTGLLNEAESRISGKIFWFDPHRFVHESMGMLGPSFDPAREVVTMELGFLLRRFPGLADLRFNDDTPFADDDTRQWIRDVVLAAPAADGQETQASPGRPPVDGQDEEFRDIQAQAQELARKKKTGDALVLLLEAAKRSTSQRQQFLRRLGLVHFLIRGREHRLALAQLEVLDETIVKFGLDQWEPGITVEVLQLMLTCQRQMVKKEWKAIPEAAQRVEEIFSRLARLDAGAALGVKG